MGIEKLDRKSKMNRFPALTLKWKKMHHLSENDINLRLLRIIKITLFTGFIITPLVFWPKASLPYEIPKLVVIQRWIELQTLLVLISFSSKNINKKYNKPTLFLVLAYLIWVVFSSLFGANFQKSLVGNYYRSDGIFTLIHLIVFTLIFILFYKKLEYKSLFSAIVFGSFLVSLISLVLGIRLYLFDIVSTPNWYSAIGSTFGQPNFLGGYLLVTLPFLYYLVKSGSQNIGKYTLKNILTSKFFWIAVLATQLIAILLTKSTASILGVLLSFIVYVIFFKKKVYRSLITYILIGLFSVLFFSTLKFQVLNQGQFNAESRGRIIRKALFAFEKRPLLGWGWANFDYAFDSVIWPMKVDNDVYVDKAHSSLLEVLTTTGIFGFLIYITLLTKVFTNLARSKEPEKKYLLMTFVLLFYHMQTNIVSISEELIFWLIVGVSANSG